MNDTMSKVQSNLGPIGHVNADTKEAKMNTVNFIMQGKGGVGKSFVAFNLAQFLQSRDPHAICIDTDPLSPTLCRFEALKPIHIQIADQRSVNLQKFDAMVELIINSTSDVVIDTGSSTFLPIVDYMLDHGVFGLLHFNYKKRILVHVVLNAKTQNDLIMTSSCLESIARDFPAYVELVVWLNEFGGEIRGFTNCNLFYSIKDRILALLRIENPSPLELADITAMQNARMTYEEAIASDTFLVMARSRIFRLRDEIFGQLHRLFSPDEAQQLQEVP